MELEFCQELLLTAVLSALFAFIIGWIASNDFGNGEHSEGDAFLADCAGDATAMEMPGTLREGEAEAVVNAYGIGDGIVLPKRGLAGVEEKIVEERSGDGKGDGLEIKNESGEDVSAEAYMFVKDDDIAKKLTETVDFEKDRILVANEGEEEEMDGKNYVCFSSKVEGLLDEWRQGAEIATGGEEGSITEMGGSFLCGEDDWEGIERSELEKLFGLATEYVGTVTGAEALSRLSNNVLMELYGLHKVANEGPCYEPQPLRLKVTAWAKWKIDAQGSIEHKNTV
ncbi:hypothetical protein HPP92_004571 [Vanilla planifolia]|uniref:ACB domain-containing protein n=1 Tax=Vanilla planifolia TaxID=51239 RepID=A0A835RXQ0_VANPL|nr:hypothetical protein HPP92_004571 [Vanilla planifolia]